MATGGDVEKKRARDFGERLRRAREDRGWTLDEVGRRVGITQAYLSEVERGIKHPSKRTVRSLEAALGERYTTDPMHYLSDYLADDEMRLIEVFRTLPRSARAYHLSMLEFAASKIAAD